MGSRADFISGVICVSASTVRVGVPGTTPEQWLDFGSGNDSSCG